MLELKLKQQQDFIIENEGTHGLNRKRSKHCKKDFLECDER